MIRKYFLLIIAFLLLDSIVFAISDVDCDTSDDSGNPLCKYTGIYNWPPYISFTQLTGDNNPNTKEERDSFGTAGLRTKVDPSGIEVSFGGGAMDWYGYSCDAPYAWGHCVGVDVKLAEIECYSSGNWESTPFYDDPCPDGMCPFLVKQQTSPRRITKTRCNFLSTTQVGKSYGVEYDVVMDYYDSHNGQLAINKAFRVTNSHYLNCTSYKGCGGGETCVAISDTETKCQCIDQAGCQECLEKGEGQNCDCDAECASNRCSGGVCQAACTDECPTVGTYCEGNKLVTCSLGADGCKDKSEQTCPEGKGCWDKQCRNYKLKILALPIRWTRSDTAFKQAFNESLKIFYRQLEINKCADQAINIEWVDVSKNFSDFDCCFGWQCKFTGGTCQIDKINKYVKKGLGKDPANFDFVVGFIDENSFEVTSCDGDYGNPRLDGCRSGGTVWANEEYKHRLAHEVGHIFGLSEEYCSTVAGSTDERCNDGGWVYSGKDINYLDASQPYDCPPDGSKDSQERNCCNFKDALLIDHNCTGDRVCCLGNKNQYNGRSVMSFTDVESYSPGEVAFEGHSLAHLNIKDELRCD